MKRILALDLGTKCGWAYGQAPIIISSGTWHLQTSTQRRFESAGMKWVRLERCLTEIGKVDHVVMEEVRRHAGTDAAHAYGGALAVVTGWCERHSVSYESIPVATIKRHATGKGNAPKDVMIQSAKARGWCPSDDNEADALWLLDLAMTSHA